MRNLGELLRICSKYNVHFGGVWNGMCLSAGEAYSRREITWDELCLVRRECSELVGELTNSTVLLDKAIRGRFNIGDVSEAVRQIYGAWIDKSEGK